MAVSFVAGAFAIGGYAVFHNVLFKNTMSLLSVSHIETSLGQKYGTLRQDIVLAASQRVRLSLTFGARGLAISQEGPGTIAIEAREKTRIGDILIGRWGIRRLRVETVLPMAVTGQVTREGAFYRLTVTNESAWTIRGGLMIYRGEPYFVGTIRPGDSLSETFRYRTGVAPTKPEISLAELIDPGQADSEIKRAMLQQLLENQELIDADAVVLAGWIDQPLSPFTTEREFFSDRRVTLITVVLPLTKSSHEV